MPRVESATGKQGSAADLAAFREVRATLGQAFFTEKTELPPERLFRTAGPRAARRARDPRARRRAPQSRRAGRGRRLALPDDFAELVAFAVFARMHADAVEQGHAFTYLRPMINHVPRALPRRRARRRDPGARRRRRRRAAARGARARGVRARGPRGPRRRCGLVADAGAARRSPDDRGGLLCAARLLRVSPRGGPGSARTRRERSSTCS